MAIPGFKHFGQAEFRASQLKECFYCSGKLPASSREHVFNACWAGTHKTSSIICDDCNAAFAPVDGSFSGHVQFIMNAWGFKGSRQQEIPTIRSDHGYVLRPFGRPEIESPELAVDVRPDGRLDVRVNAKSKGEARRLLLDSGKLEAALGRQLTDEEREQILKVVRETTPRKEFLTSFETRVELDFQGEYRSIAHTALKCAALYAPSLVTHDVTKTVRDFARNGAGNWRDFAIEVRSQFDQSAMARKAFGVNYNAAQIFWSRELRMVIGVVTILDRIKRAVILASDCDTEDAALLVFEKAGAGGGELRSLFAQVEDQLPPVPHLEILQRPPSEESLANELASLAGNSIGVDALMASLLAGLEKAVDAEKTVTGEDVEKCRVLLCEYVAGAARSFHIPVDPEQVAGAIEKNNFARVRNCVGKKAVESNLAGELGEVLVATLKKLFLSDRP